MDAKGVTQVQLGQALGVSQSAISNYLKGRIPKSDILFALAKFFSVTTDHLLTGIGELHAQQDFSQRLRRIRVMSKLSMGSFGQVIGYHKSYVSRLESARNTNPSPEFIEAVCSVYGVNRRWLETGEGEMKVAQATPTQRVPRDISYRDWGVAQVKKGESEEVSDLKYRLQVMRGLHERIKYVRERYGLSQDEFAARIEIPVGSLGDLEAGAIISPPSIFFKKMWEVFFVQQSWLRSGEGKPFPEDLSDKAQNVIFQKWNSDRAKALLEECLEMGGNFPAEIDKVIDLLKFAYKKDESKPDIIRFRKVRLLAEHLLERISQEEKAWLASKQYFEAKRSPEGWIPVEPALLETAVLVGIDIDSIRVESDSGEWPGIRELTPTQRAVLSEWKDYLNSLQRGREFLSKPPRLKPNGEVDEAEIKRFLAAQNKWTDMMTISNEDKPSVAPKERDKLPAPAKTE